jgi:hypothetical protein
LILTTRPSSSGEHFYALQLRYAQNETKGEQEETYDIEPLDKDKLQSVITFVMQMAEAERAGVRAWITGGIAVLAAVISAVAAITVALLAHRGTP